MRKNIRDDWPNLQNIEDRILHNISESKTLMLWGIFIFPEMEALMKTYSNSIRNVIGKVIPLYPNFRPLCDCSRSELLLNNIICRLTDNMENPRKETPYYRELLSIVNEFVHDLRDAGVSDDRWEIYSAAIISHIAALSKSCFPYEYNEYANRDIREMACDNEVAGAVFRLAESLIELRNMAEYKRSGKPYPEKSTGDNDVMDENGFRKVLEKVDDRMTGNAGCREYRILMEKVFGNSASKWESLNGRGIEGLKKMLSELPLQCVLFKGELYRVDGFDRFSNSWNRIDDVEFGEMETGIIIKLKGAGGHGFEKIWIYNKEENKTWREIFAEHNLQFPDRNEWELMADLTV